MTPRAVQILKKMRDDSSADILCNGIEVWCGTERISRRTLHQFIFCLAITMSDCCKDEYYHLNDCGRAILRRPALENEIRIALMADVKFTIKNDRLVKL